MNHVVLIGKDPVLVETVTALGLALEVEVKVVAGRDEVRGTWADASVRLIEPELLPRVSHLPSHPSSWVVGRDAVSVVDASARLDVPAIIVPDSTGKLAEVVASVNNPERDGQVIAVHGTAGGLGASSFCAALAMHAASVQGSAALVELAACGGGIDLLLGIEAQPGLRWDALAGARGEVGEIAGLPHVDGVDVVALSREAWVPPDEESARAIVRAMRRHHPCVVIDAGRSTLTSALPDAVHLEMVGADVRGVAAAQQHRREFPASPGYALVRTGPGRNLPSDVVAQAAGLPLAGSVRTDRAVPRLAVEGLNVGSSAARKLRRDVRRVWEVIADAVPA